MSWQDAIRAAAEAGNSVVIMEPPEGLTEAQRAIVAEAVQLMANGEVLRAQALLGDIGFAFTVNRVQDGTLVPIQPAEPVPPPADDSIIGTLQHPRPAEPVK